MYVKAPKEFVDYLASVHGYDHRYDTSNDRQVFADGNYLLWDRDFLPLCSSENIAATLPALGCVALTAQQVRAEQDGTCVNELPPITDERLLEFLGKTEQTVESEPETPVESEPIDEESATEEEGGDTV
jgi:hypothetical protein